jgi:hypothetical protein
MPSSSGQVRRDHLWLRGSPPRAWLVAIIERHEFWRHLCEYGVAYTPKRSLPARMGPILLGKMPNMVLPAHANWASAVSVQEFVRKNAATFTASAEAA